MLFLEINYEMCSTIPEISFEFDKAVNLVVELLSHLNCYPISFSIHHVPWSLIEILKFSSIGTGYQSRRVLCVR